ncbi:MAG: hypothetical protein H6703_13715 [Myxococcales bacterium]|nr:hypothetical protein [Myxococcales bacterium]
MKKWLLLGLVGGGLLLALLMLVFATAGRAPDATRGTAGKTRPEDLFGDLKDDEYTSSLREEGEAEPPSQAMALPRRVEPAGYQGEDSRPGAAANAPADPAATKIPVSELDALDTGGGRAIGRLFGGDLGGDGGDGGLQAAEATVEPELAEPPAPTTRDAARFAEMPREGTRAATGERAAAQKPAGRTDDFDHLSRRIPPVEGYDPDAGEPATTLPPMAYFENTYLGGNAAYREQLRRLDAAIQRTNAPWRRAALPPQPFDGPGSAGLSVSAAIDRAWIGQPSRALLQIGLQGSARAGWRRPPLDVVAVIDPAALTSPAHVVRSLGALIAHLGPADRLAVRRIGDAAPLVPLNPPENARRVLLRDPRALLDDPPSGDITAALAAAGAELDATADSARIPGTGVVLLIVEGEDPARAAAAQAAAHRLTTEGVTVSVLEHVDGPLAPPGAWWAVAHAGHGGHHRVARGERPDGAIEDELDRLSRIVARLVRVNIRLAPGVRAVRVLGSRLLRSDEVRQVKAREKAVDARLSRTLGVSADRGDDDDGLQTVIPYFLGEDTHVILIELWVERAGPIADVTVRYKDMVRLANGRAAAHVELGALPREPGPVQAQVRQNAQGVAFAEELANAARAARDGDDGRLEIWLKRAEAHAPDPADERLVAALRAMRMRGPRLGTALEVSARRRLGVGHALATRE